MCSRKKQKEALYRKFLDMYGIEIENMLVDRENAIGESTDLDELIDTVVSMFMIEKTNKPCKKNLTKIEKKNWVKFFLILIQKV